MIKRVSDPLSYHVSCASSSLKPWHSISIIEYKKLSADFPVVAPVFLSWQIMQRMEYHLRRLGLVFLYFCFEVCKIWNPCDHQCFLMLTSTLLSFSFIFFLMDYKHPPSFFFIIVVRYYKTEILIISIYEYIRFRSLWLVLLKAFKKNGS